MFIARIVFFGPSKGGRTTPPRSGYHPQLDVGGTYTSCIIEHSEHEYVFAFDHEYEVFLQLMFPEDYGHDLTVGSPVHLYEGDRLVASGVITDADV